MITVTVALRRLESPAFRLFAQGLLRAYHKKHTKALPLWPYPIRNHRCTGFAHKLSLMREVCPCYKVMFPSPGKTDALALLNQWVCTQNIYGSFILATLDMITSWHGYAISSASLPLCKEVHWSKVVSHHKDPVV